jgi:LmbE family N-acetylglucosaminyl deacetylase
MQSEFKPFLSAERPLFLDALPLSSGLRVVVLAPHPDDFDLIGVTMRRLRDNGNRIDLAVLTSGASGVEDCFQPNLTNASKAAIREAEQRASCQFFGLPEDRLTFLRLQEDGDGHLEASGANLERLQTYWLAHPVDLVFLPHRNDTNAAHQRTYALFRQILAANPRPLVALLNRDPKTLAMRDDVLTVFTAAEAAWKGELLRFHQTQHQRNLRTRQHGIDARILRVNRQTAARLQISAEYAESFELELFLPDATR